MQMGWDDFEEALGEDGLVHVVQKGVKLSLCGRQVTDHVVASQRTCPLCRGLRRDAISASS